MSTTLLITILIFIYSVFCSVNQQRVMFRQLNAYKSLVSFSKKAEDNLNGVFDDISAIISNEFNVSNTENICFSFWKSLGFHDTDIKEIMDYTVSYNRNDIDTLKKASVIFREFASDAYKRTEADHQRKTPALLCPPICALILLVLII